MSEFSHGKGETICYVKCYTIAEKDYIIHTFPDLNSFHVKTIGKAFCKMENAFMIYI